MLAARRAAFSRLSAHRRPRRTYASSSVEENVDYDLQNYPKVPDVSRQYRPPFGWQDQQERRNLGDPLHERDELYSMWGPDIPAVPPETAIRHFGLAILGFVSLGLVVRYVVAPEPPMVRRQYPFGGLSKELAGIDQARPEEENEEE